MPGTLLGYVFNKALSKSIPVYITESGPSFKRLTGAIDTQVRNLALSKIKAAFEGGKLFTDDDMKAMERITISNMSHESDGDPNAHYSVQGEDAGGSKIKGGHVQEDESKQTVSSHPASSCLITMLIPCE
ncbi:hypothetical protein ACJ73_09320 [Blastomyces percursus]|uniref:Uncharacterized protein n=1 Tax=Blastomyces percursus TaxID=1658174 RepID=A0A1J9P974_9EURO|nr:hypothetical protein ACJ73_09320 [Blastomyces percursus]